ncbi:MAG: hypothetical protein ABIR57_09905 [Aeromicrobium sp.]
MDPVATHYIDRDGAALAYQVVGDGPFDVVHFYEAFQHLDLQLTDPDINYNVERMARFLRTVYFQRRGSLAPPSGWAMRFNADEPEHRRDN